MPIYWYALHSHPNKETSLSRELEARGIEVFFPQLRVKPVNPRARILRPYFPGYMFVRADLDQTGTSVFQWMPYSTGLVSFGGEASSVPEALIANLRHRLATAEAVARSKKVFAPGDRVMIEAGPFAGYEAVFDLHLSGTERVRVLLNMLSNRFIPVELDAKTIRKP